MPPLAAVPDLDAELDELYGLPLEDWTKARNDLAARLKKAHQGEQAEEVRTLRQPPLVAVRPQARPRIDELREARERIKELRAEARRLAREAREAEENAERAGREAERLREEAEGKRAAADEAATALAQAEETIGRRR